MYGREERQEEGEGGGGGGGVAEDKEIKSASMLSESTNDHLLELKPRKKPAVPLPATVGMRQSDGEGW